MAETSTIETKLEPDFKI